MTELFRQTLLRQPELTAVQDPDGTDSYAGLARRAAWIQQQFPAQPSRQVIAIYCQRQRGLVAAMLAALCAGHCYLLIDTGLPQGRIRQILQDSQASVLVCDGAQDFGLMQIRLDWADTALQQSDSTGPLQYVTLTGSEPAYLIYTSGSTGTPKGIQVPHRGLMDYCAFALQHYYRPAALTGSWLITSHSFDISVPALWLPLLAGGCVRLLPATDVIEHTAELLLQQADLPVLLRMTPSHVQALLALLPATFRSSARHSFVIGGEPFKTADARQLAARFPLCRIINHYGPSETVVGSTWLPLTDDPQRLVTATAAVLPIGRPMSNTKAYVVNQQGQLQPPGVVGELWLSGVCVADGYLQQPALTAEKFVPNPFSSEPEYQRCYRTGDLVRWVNGELIFLGRLDTQIKLRGFRVEVSAVEAALCQLAPVAQAAVKKYPEREALIAWVTCHQPDWTGEALRAQLAAVLPEYLIPELIIQLEALPLSANGKVNYRALVATVASGSQAVVAAASPTEQRLCELWAQILQQQPSQICVNRSFFSQGGNSVLAVLLIGRIRKHFACDWKVRRLFELPTVRQQAAALVAAVGASATGSTVIELRAAAAAQQTLVLLHPIEGELAAYRQLVEQLPAGWRVLGLAQPVAESGHTTVWSLPQRAEYYLAQLQSQINGRFHLLGWSMGGLLAIEMARQLRAAGQAVGYVGALDSSLVPATGLWQQLQQQGDVAAQYAIVSQQLAADDQFRQQFDQAFRVTELAAIFAEPSQQLRELIAANMVASRDYVGQFAAALPLLPYLHYVGAAANDGMCRQQMTQATSLASQVVLTEVALADHFSLLHPPHLQAVVDAVSQQLTQFMVGE